jgi:hypothetical protein
VNFEGLVQSLKKLNPHKKVGPPQIEEALREAKSQTLGPEMVRQAEKGKHSPEHDTARSEMLRLDQESREYWAKVDEERKAARDAEDKARRGSRRGSQ